MKTNGILAIAIASIISTSCSIQSQIMTERIMRDAQWTLEYSIKNEVNQAVYTSVRDAAEKIRNANNWQCPQCGHRNGKANFCPECGHENPYLEWDCHSCGQRHITGNYCPACGEKKQTHRHSH